MLSADDQTLDAEATTNRPPLAVNIVVPASFACHAEAAIIRLRYLFPSWEIEASAGCICITGVRPVDMALAQREVSYALYRERIRAEGAPLRELLLRSVMS